MAVYLAGLTQQVLSQPLQVLEQKRDTAARDVPSSACSNPHASSPDAGATIIDRDTLVNLYRLPLPAAAAQLGMSINTLRKTCRKLGVTRWPYNRHHETRTGENRWEDESSGLAGTHSAQTASQLGTAECRGTKSHQQSEASASGASGCCGPLMPTLVSPGRQIQDPSAVPDVTVGTSELVQTHVITPNQLGILFNRGNSLPLGIQTVSGPSVVMSNSATNTASQFGGSNVTLGHSMQQNVNYVRIMQTTCDPVVSDQCPASRTPIHVGGSNVMLAQEQAPQYVLIDVTPNRVFPHQQTTSQSHPGQMGVIGGTLSQEGRATVLKPRAIRATTCLGLRDEKSSTSSQMVGSPRTNVGQQPISVGQTCFPVHSLGSHLNPSDLSMSNLLATVNPVIGSGVTIGPMRMTSTGTQNPVGSNSCKQANESRDRGRLSGTSCPSVCKASRPELRKERDQRRDKDRKRCRKNRAIARHLLGQLDVIIKSRNPSAVSHRAQNSTMPSKQSHHAVLKAVVEEVRRTQVREILRMHAAVHLKTE